MELIRNIGDQTVAYLSQKLGVYKSEGFLFFMLAIAAAIMLAPNDLFAATGAENTIVSDAVCRVVNQLTGPVGRGVAAVAVIFVGFSLFLGKISWGLAIAIGMGIAAIFGAQSIVEFFNTGGQGTACTLTK